MKTGLIAVLAILMGGGLLADDLVLTDGRVLKNATVRSEQTGTVTILHDGGLSSVSKALLPAPLRSRYPLDPAAVEKKKQDDAQRLAARLEAEARQKEQKQALAKSKATDEASSTSSVPENPSSLCQGLAEGYFRNEYIKNSPYVIRVEVSISTPEPKEGWSHCWTFTGSAIVRQYDEQALARELAAHPRPGVESPATIGKSAKELRRADEAPLISVETRRFEATVTAGDGPASISVALR